MNKTTNQMKKNKKTNTPSSIFAVHSPFHSFPYPLFESLLIHGTMLVEKQSITLFHFCFSFCQKRLSSVRGTDVRNGEYVCWWYWFCVDGRWGFVSTRGLCFGWECDAFGYYLITIKIQVCGGWMKKSEEWSFRLPQGLLTRFENVFRFPTKTVSPSTKYAYNVCIDVNKKYLQKISTISRRNTYYINVLTWWHRTRAQVSISQNRLCIRRVLYHQPRRQIASLTRVWRRYGDEFAWTSLVGKGTLKGTASSKGVSCEQSQATHTFDSIITSIFQFCNIVIIDLDNIAVGWRDRNWKRACWFIWRLRSCSLVCIWIAFCHDQMLRASQNRRRQSCKVRPAYQRVNKGITRE